MEQYQVALMTKCLWEFQEMLPEIDGIMLVSHDGFIIASTFVGGPSASRLAAVSSALVGLARRISPRMSCGPMVEVWARLEDGSVLLKPAGDDATMIILMHSPPRLNSTGTSFPINTHRAIEYVVQVMNGDDPPPITWL
jgi:predicted regulator of Ras-like GTPase activity (Roadblock/LC7/MglB family)